MTEHSGASYQGKARQYAELVDQKPIHLYYARPGLNAVLPPLAGKHVLDCGSGSGWYAEFLLEQGATVTTFDYDPEFVTMTAERVGSRATVLQADLARPLAFAADRSVDLVIAPLVLHYLKDWQPPLRELARVLKPGGYLAFSTHHPFNDWQLFERDDYFACELLTDEWEIGTVQFYRRPLRQISDDLAAAGFVIEQIHEPQPTAEYFAIKPEGAEQLNKQPWFLMIRARREGGSHAC